MKNSNDKNLNRLWLVGASVNYTNLGVGKVVKVSVQEPDGDWKKVNTLICPHCGQQGQVFALKTNEFKNNEVSHE